MKKLHMAANLTEAFNEAFKIALEQNPDAGTRMKLKFARQVLGLSQREFADLFDLPYPTVRNWELEGGSSPSGAAKTLIEIFAQDPVKVSELAERAKSSRLKCSMEVA